MRYLLLVGLLIAASFALPYSRLSDTPVGQPVPPVQVATLGAMPDVMALGTDAAPVADAPAPAVEVDAGPDVAPDIVPPVAAPVIASLPMPAPGPAPAPADLSAPAKATADAAPLPPHLPVPAFAVQAFAHLPYVELASLFAGEPRSARLSAEQAAADLMAAIAPQAPDIAAAAPPPPAAARRAPDPNSDPLGPVGERVTSLRLDRNTAPIVIATLNIPDPAPAAPAAPAENTATAPAPADAAPQLLKVTASALNMRAGPSSSHAVVAGLTRGALAEPLGAPRGGWVRVRLHGSDRTGWLFTRYVEKVGGA